MLLCLSINIIVTTKININYNFLIILYIKLVATNIVFLKIIFENIILQIPQIRIAYVAMYNIFHKFILHMNLLGPNYNVLGNA